MASRPLDRTLAALAGCARRSASGPIRSTPSPPTAGAAGGDRHDAFEHGLVRIWEPPGRLAFEMSGRDFRPGERTEVEVQPRG